MLQFAQQYILVAQQLLILFAGNADPSFGRRKGHQPEKRGALLIFDHVRPSVDLVALVPGIDGECPKVFVVTNDSLAKGGIIVLRRGDAGY